MTAVASLYELSQTELSVWVCVNVRIGSPSCGGQGSDAVAKALEHKIAAEKLPVKLVRTPCQGRCSRGPVVRVLPDPELFFGVRKEDLEPVMARLRARVVQAQGQAQGEHAGVGPGQTDPDAADPDLKPANPLAPPWIFGQ